MATQRLEATHFAEVWRGNYGYHNADVIMPIRDLELTLEESRIMGYNTIAIWKIKFKKP